MNKLFASAVFLFVFCCSGGVAWSQDTILSVMSDTKWSQTPVDNASMNKRIADAAEEYRQYPQYLKIPRIAFYDVGFPKDKVEFNKLNGYGLLLISSLSQDETELPLKRAYASVAGRDIELVQFKQALIKNTDPKSQVFKTFGAFRADTFYLFPVYLQFETTEIFIDFSRNRKGMKIAALSVANSGVVKGLPRARPVAGRSIDEPMKLFMKREYPGYLDK